MKTYVNPLVSIITVTYNAERFLEKTIQAVSNQTYEDIEYIIIDGGSTDRTLSIIQQYKNYIHQWVSEPDKGIYDAMNKGINLANGKYLNFLNAGDSYCAPNTVSEVVTQGGGADLIYGNFYVVDNHDHIITVNKAKPFTFENLRKYQVGVLNHQTVFIKKAKTPLYSEDYKIKAELNWYFDILEQNDNDLSVCRLNIPMIKFQSGGYADRIFWEQTSEFMKIMYRRASYLGVVFALRSFLYTIAIRLISSVSRRN